MLGPGSARPGLAQTRLSLPKNVALPWSLVVNGPRCLFTYPTLPWCLLSARVAFCVKKPGSIVSGHALATLLYQVIRLDPNTLPRCLARCGLVPLGFKFEGSKEKPSFTARYLRQATLAATAALAVTY